MNAIWISRKYNRFLSEFSYHHRLIYSLNHPRIFGLETTNFCNLNCIMCPRDKMTRPKGFMDFELVKSLIDQTCKYSSLVRLHEMGEPLLDKNICKIIDYCAEKKLCAEISTNATVLSESKAREILSSKLHRIILCLDGATKETYEAIRRKANFEQIVENIRTFLLVKKELGNVSLQTQIQIILMKETEREISVFTKNWQDAGADKVVVKKFSTFSNQVEGVKEHSDLSHRYKDKAIEKRYPCSYLWDSVVVLWDGSVVPCCRDFDGKIILGNAKETSLEEIWNGPKMQDLRRKQINGHFGCELCRDCVEWPSKASQRFYPFSWQFADDIRKALCKQKK